MPHPQGAANKYTVPTSSCGRLFDAVSATPDICLENRYEAEVHHGTGGSGVLRPTRLGSFGFDLCRDEIDFRQTFREIAAAARKGEPVTVISPKFHNTLASAIHAACTAVRAAECVRIVCSSSGRFHNMRLVEETSTLLERSGFEAFYHLQVPSNDGGLSLGQAVIANARTGR